MEHHLVSSTFKTYEMIYFHHYGNYTKDAHCVPKLIMPSVTFRCLLDFIWDLCFVSCLCAKSLLILFCHGVVSADNLCIANCFKKNTHSASFYRNAIV